LLTGVSTSLRRLFAETKVNECNRDISPTIQRHVRNAVIGYNIGAW
jgi:hypothetical protein